MQKRSTRVLDATAFVLHATPWRETSLLVKVFSRDHGILLMAAKGAKRPYSGLRAVLSVFQPVQLSWAGRNEVRTLMHAESVGALNIAGQTLMSCWYMNELLLKTLAREDPHPQLFDAYDQALRQLALGTSTNNVLRKFEWLFLQETGYGADEPMPDFDDPIQAAQAKQLLRRRIVEHFELNRLATREVMQSLMPFITSRSTAIPSID
jgi:DNA repair protein RecO (recombination protein O)